MNEITAMRTKLGNKRIALTKDKTKKASLENQIEIYRSALDNIVGGMEQKEKEIWSMDRLIEEYVVLDKEKTTLLSGMVELREKYDSIPWRPDLTREERIENSEYPKLEARLAEVQARLNEIPKEVNRTYYRRGTE